MNQKSAMKRIAGAAVLLTAAISLPAYAGKTLDTMKQRGAADLRRQRRSGRVSPRPTARATGPGSTWMSARRSPPPCWATRQR